MQIITQPYRNDGPLNKLVVSLNNSVHSRPILRSIESTGRAPHVLVDHEGNVEVLADPRQAVVPFQGQNLRSPHNESPAVWVEFTGTGPDDLADIDVVGILKSLCEQFGVEYVFPTVPDDLARKTYTKTAGIVQRKSLRGHANASLLPIPAPAKPVTVEEWEAFEAEKDEIPALEASASNFEVQEEEPEVVEEPAAEWPEFKGRPLKLGSKSEKIALIAEAHGLESVEYDEDIEMLVTSTQEEAGLEADGVIDAVTWAALNPNK